jgi:hypothetical protein
MFKQDAPLLVEFLERFGLFVHEAADRCAADGPAL